MRNAWVGIPYCINATPPDGADCYTLAKAYAREELGQEWPAYLYDAGHLLHSANGLIAVEMHEHGRWLKQERPAHGDLLILRIAGLSAHCAIYLGAGDMLHTMKGKASCVERLEAYADSLTGVFRWAGGSHGV